MSDLRTAAQQALEALETYRQMMFAEAGCRWDGGDAAITALRAALAQQDEPRNQCGETCERAKLCATCAQVLAQQDEPDLSRCPQCNGPADNGFDRSIPPSPYLCTKCMAEPVTEDMKSAVRWAPSSAYWSERLREFFGPDAREGIDALERRLAEAQQAEPVQEPVAEVFVRRDGVSFAFWLKAPPPERTKLYTAPPQRLPLTEEEILKAIGWERAEMYMKLAPNFPVDEAKQETLKNARAVEKASWEKNHG